MLYDSIYMNYPEKGKFIDKKIGSYQELGQGREESLYNGHRVSVWSNEFWNQIKVKLYNTVNVINATKLHTTLWLKQ